MRLAAALVAVESIAIAGLSLVLLVRLATGHPYNAALGVFAALLGLLTAAALGWWTRGLLAGRRGALSPVVLAQLIALPVGWNSAHHGARLGGYVALLLAAATLLTLFATPAARAHFRPPAGQAES